MGKDKSYVAVELFSIYSLEGIAVKLYDLGVTENFIYALFNSTGHTMVIAVDTNINNISTYYLKG